MISERKEIYVPWPRNQKCLFDGPNFCLACTRLVRPELHTKPIPPITASRVLHRQAARLPSHYLMLQLRGQTSNRRQRTKNQKTKKTMQRRSSPNVCSMLFPTLQP